ncbi:Protein yls7 [Ranunculus cassubicifolius]
MLAFFDEGMMAQSEVAMWDKVQSFFHTWLGWDDPKFTPVSDFTDINNTSTVTTPQEPVSANNSQTSLPSSQVYPNATMPDSGGSSEKPWQQKNTEMVFQINKYDDCPYTVLMACSSVIRRHRFCSTWGSQTPLRSPRRRFHGCSPEFDVVVLSSGHWFAKQSVYVLNNEIVGGQLWWPDKNRKMKVNNIDAFGISVETIMTAIGNHPNFTGLTIVRSFSPDHYEGGAWNTGGSCTGKSSPALELVENGFTNIMHEKQVTGFNEAVKKVVTTNGSKLKLMDITEAFSYRHDGHPGPYRSPDPNKITKRGPHGEPPPQDCLHWCMPGPVDTWNEMVLEIIRREFEGVDTGSSSSLL